MTSHTALVELALEESICAHSVLDYYYYHLISTGYSGKSKNYY